MTRDEVLGAALRALPVPDPAPGFFDDLATRLEEPGIGTAGTPRGAADSTGRRPVPRWLPAVAAAVAAMAAGVALGVSLPGRDAPVVAGDGTAVSDITAALVTAGDVPELTPVSHFDVAASPGAKVFGAQLLSPVNLKRLESQVGAVAGSRTEYIRPDGQGGLSSAGVLFGSETAASQALGFIVGVLPDQNDPASGTTPLGSDLTEGPLTEIAADGLGDEAIGFEGPMDSRYPGTTQTLFVWRDDAAVFAVWGTGFETDEVREFAVTVASRFD